MSSTPVFEGNPRTGHALFVPAFSTRYRPVFIAGTSGSIIKQIHIASTDASSNNVQFAIGKKITDASAMGSGLFVDGGGGSDTITRSSGSFVSDGWQVGDRFTVLNSTTLANDFFALLTAAIAGTLTFATSTVNTAEAFAATTALYRLGLTWQKAVAAAAGSSSTAAASGLDPTLAPALPAAPDNILELGPNDVLFAAVTTAMGAGEIMDIIATGRDI